MSTPLDPNTQAILLLTAPLIAGRGETSADLLSLGEYNRLAWVLRDSGRQPADLLGPDAGEISRRCEHVVEGSRLARLLGRGFLLSQAVERWHARSIWVVSRAEPSYPRRWKSRLKESAPPIVYGCGDATILETPGLAVVGSRDADGDLLAYTERIGALAADAHRVIFSGGARGIDQASMRGALQAGGRAAGVLADSLERAALTRENRDLLRSRRLVLLSPYDPAAGFNVGHAMQRNKLIYALADAALVVNADYQKGGTWAGAIEQLEKLQMVPVYVRAHGSIGRGLDALRGKGALPWPDVQSPAAIIQVLAAPVSRETGPSEQGQIRLHEAREPRPDYGDVSLAGQTSPALELFAKVKELLAHMKIPKTDEEIAADLQVNKSQVREWLQRLVSEGVLERLSKPVRYRSICN